MDIICINEIHKYSKEDVIFLFGVIRVDKEITIFLLDNESHSYFVDCTAHVLLSILKYYKLSVALDLYKWVFVAGAGVSDIIIDTQKNIPTILTFSNGSVLQPYCCALNMSVYEAAFKTGPAFRETLLQQYSENLRASFCLSAEKFYLVSIPFNPKYMFHMMSNPYGNLDENKFPVLFVSTDKFITYWKNQCSDKGNFFLSGIDCDDKILLSSTFDVSLRYALPRQMAEGVGFDHNRKIRFTNGRHRTVNLASMGAPLIPIQVNKESVADFNRMFAL